MNPFTYAIRKIRSQRRPLRWLTALILKETRVSRFFIADRDGYRIRFSYSNIAKEVWTDPSWRIEEEKFVRSQLLPGDIFVDVGANIGTLTLAAAVEVGKHGKVYAFEPHPKIVKLLENNITLNQFQNVEVYPYAVGDESGIVHFRDIWKDDRNSIDWSVQKGLAVEKKKLDELLPRNQRIKLLKIDVEGYELGVLRGAEQTLRNTETLHIEISDRLSNRFGYSAKESLQFLEDRGFSIARRDGESLTPVDATYCPIDVEDFVAKKTI